MYISSIQGNGAYSVLGSPCMKNRHAYHTYQLP